MPLSILQQQLKNGILMLKKDNFLFGMLVGLVLPVLTYIILYFGGMLLGVYENRDNLIDSEEIKLISIFINLIPLRYYFLSLKSEQSGRGVLLMTFVLGILYFIIG